MPELDFESVTTIGAHFTVLGLGGDLDGSNNRVKHEFGSRIQIHNAALFAEGSLAGYLALFNIICYGPTVDRQALVRTILHRFRASGTPQKPLSDFAIFRARVSASDRLICVRWLRSEYF